MHHPIPRTPHHTRLSRRFAPAVSNVTEEVSSAAAFRASRLMTSTPDSCLLIVLPAIGFLGTPQQGKHCKYH